MDTQPGHTDFSPLVHAEALQRSAWGWLRNLCGCIAILLILAALAFLTGCGGGGGGGGFAPMVAAAPPPKTEEPAPEQPIKPPPICTMQLEGDSIAHGDTTGGPLAESPAVAIRRLRVQWSVVDRSQNGNYVALRSPSFLVEPIESRFVVIELGMNDAGQGFDYKEPLRAMVQRVKALGKTPIVTGLSHVRGAPKWRDDYNELARQVASEEAVPFADWGSVEYADADMADDIHPGQAYSGRLAARIVEVLDQLAPECRT